MKPKTDIRTNPPEVMSITECAQYLGISERNVRQKIRSRTLPHVQLGRRILIRRAALDKAIQNLEVDAV